MIHAKETLQLIKKLSYLIKISKIQASRLVDLLFEK